MLYHIMDWDEQFSWDLVFMDLLRNMVIYWEEIKPFLGVGCSPFLTNHQKFGIVISPKDLPILSEVLFRGLPYKPPNKWLMALTTTGSQRRNPSSVAFNRRKKSSCRGRSNWLVSCRFDDFSLRLTCYHFFGLFAWFSSRYLLTLDHGVLVGPLHACVAELVVARLTWIYLA